MSKKLRLELESVRVLTSPQLDEVAGGTSALLKLFKVHTVKVPVTDGPGESFDLGYRGPFRKQWVWDGKNRVWHTH